MPALTISAVDFTTGKLTVTAHGQVTGAGPARIFAGSGGVIPTLLAPVTDYWLIVVDANNVKVASSSANALANVPVAFSSNGTLPLQLLIGLPYAVPRTAAPGVQVFSADLTSVWLALVSLWNFLTGQAQSIWSGIVLAANQHIQISGTGLYKRGTRVRHIQGSSGILVSTPVGGTNYYAAGAMQFRAVGNIAELNIILEEGEQLQSVTAFVQCGGTDVLTFKVFRSAHPVGGAGTTDTQLGATQTSAGHANANEALAVTGLTENVPNTAGTSYRCQIACTAFGSNPFFWGIDYVTTVP